MWFDVWTSSITMTNSVFLTWIPCNCRNLVFINVFLENFNWANWNELLNISIIDADVFVLHCLKHCFEPKSLHQTLLKGNGIVSNIALSQDHCIISSQVFIPLPRSLHHFIPSLHSVVLALWNVWRITYSFVKTNMLAPCCTGK